MKAGLFFAMSIVKIRLKKVTLNFHRRNGPRCFERASLHGAYSSLRSYFKVWAVAGKNEGNRVNQAQQANCDLSPCELTRLIFLEV